MIIHKLLDRTEGELPDLSGIDESKPYIAVKKCRMLRSGVQLYARDEVPQELLKELPEASRDKKVFRVYRRPEAVVKHLKDFNYIPFVNGHPDDDVTPDNVRSLEIGRVGGQAEVVTLKDGDVYVENDLVIDDRGAFAEYKEGKKELSIGLDAVWVVSDSTKYDFEVVDFVAVNHLALVPRGRAGGQAKILDSGAAVSRMTDKSPSSEGNGGFNMNGFLRLFGIGKNKDGTADFVLSKSVLDCAAKIAGGRLSADETEAEVAGVMRHVTRLTDSEEKNVLVGMVADAITGASELDAADAEAKGKVADAIDSLYRKCMDADEAKTKEVVEKMLSDGCGKADDACKDEKKPDNDPENKKDEGKKDDGKDAKDAPQKDSAELIQAAVAKALDGAVKGMVEEAVRKALGVVPEAQAHAKQKDSSSEYSEEELMLAAWGR